MNEQDDIDARLARLRDATARVGARGDFALRVMSRVAASAPPTWADALVRPASRWVFGATLLVLLSGAWAYERAREQAAAVDDVLATSYAVVEVEW
jgi:hypothetical protein